MDILLPVVAEGSKIAGVELSPEKLAAIKGLVAQFATLPKGKIDEIKRLLHQD